MQLSKTEGQTYSLRRSDSCFGWHCLTSATRFGIIFSTVVTFLILSIVWMYCTGKARIFRTKTKADLVSSRQRGRRHNRNSKSTKRPGSPIVPRIPVFGYGMAQSFPIYFLPAPQVLATQSLGVMNPHIAQIYPPVPTKLPQETQYPKHSNVTASEPPKAQDSPQEPDPAPENESSSHHLTWWQRFYRAFNLPIGAASTIASSPSPEPLQSIVTNTNHPVTDRCLENISSQLDNHTDRGFLELTTKEQDETSSMLCNLNTSSDSLESIRTDVATVHSDDFEITPRR